MNDKTVTYNHFITTNNSVPNPFQRNFHIKSNYIRLRLPPQILNISFIIITLSAIPVEISL